MDHAYEVGIVYERVKFRNTGQARRILSRKDPKSSINYPEFESFVKQAVIRDIIPGFFFESLYVDGRKTIPTKPECMLINRELTTGWYSKYILSRSAHKVELIGESLFITRENIDMYLDDYDLRAEPGKIFDNDPLERFAYSDFALMIKLGMVSGYLLFLHKSLERFFKFLPANIDIKVLNSTYRRYNREGKMDKLLSALFHDIKPN